MLESTIQVFFKLGQSAKSCRVVSFLNCLFGGYVFGPIWNHSLTIKTKSASNIVAVVLCVFSLALCVLLAWVTMAIAA